MFKRPSFLIITALISIIFFALIAFDFSPYLRGPAPYPPDWRWPYEPINTLSRIWAPLGVIALIILIFKKKENKNLKSRNYKTMLVFVILSFLLQISLLYYSRSGVEVLVHRTINPMISGYFSVSNQIFDLGSFLRNYNQSLYDYPMYARFHPPGGVLFYYLLEFILKPFSHLFANILSVNPTHSDVALLWNSLEMYQKFNALVSGFVVAFIASLSIIPIYLSSRILYGEKAAIRSSVLFIFVPSLLLFTPLIDVFMPLFTCTSLYLYLKGNQTKNYLYYFFAGLILFLGAFFTLTFIPLLFFFSLLFLIKFIQDKEDLKTVIGNFISFSSGFLLIPFLLFFSGFNFIDTVRTIMIYHEAAQAGREHLTWYFYNLYDFILFAGIPVGIMFAYLMFDSVKTFRKTKSLKKIDYVFLSFIIMLLAVNFSGTVRAETGRIWLPFVPLLIIVVANFVTNKLKFTSQQFILLLLLQATQVLIFQSVLVAVW
ncbi:MAG: hypothetical protein KBD51_01795 [Candidatus Levybacteria bacterium]|nr:hypothetical protein [Candidatus Levybacteria bacterium]